MFFGAADLFQEHVRQQVEREAMEYDVVVVGAGLATSKSVGQAEDGKK